MWQFIFLTTLAILLLACMGVIISNDKTVFPNLWRHLSVRWVQWDARHYIDIAERGYQTAPEKKFLISYYPAYPLLIRGLGTLIGNFPLAAGMIANISSMVGFWLFYKLARLDFDRQTSWRALIAMMLFPTAYFFHVPYTEGLFLALVVGAWYAARQKRWDWAGLLGCLAALTRNPGIMLFPALLLEWWLQRQEGSRHRLMSLAYIGLIPLGFVLYLGLNWYLFNSPFEFVHMLPTVWHRYVTWPWVGLLRAWHLTTQGGISQLTLTQGVFEVAASVGLMAACVWSYKKLRSSYSLFLCLTTFLAVAANYLLSTPRYMLSSFPLFLLLGMGIKDWRTGLPLLVISLGVLTMYMTRFLNGQWAF